MESPAREQTAPEPDGYVTFLLGGARYGVGMSAVAEVGRLPGLTRVPGTPSWLAGVANWRGRILAVLDLRPLLGAAITPTGSLGRLLVLAVDGVTVGLRTDGVQGVVPGGAGSIEAPPMTLDAQALALLAGQFSDDEGSVAVVDPTAVLGLRHRLDAARRAS